MSKKTKKIIKNSIMILVSSILLAFFVTANTGGTWLWATESEPIDETINSSNGDEIATASETGSDETGGEGGSNDGESSGGVVLTGPGSDDGETGSIDDTTSTPDSSTESSSEATGSSGTTDSSSSSSSSESTSETGSESGSTNESGSSESEVSAEDGVCYITYSGTDGTKTEYFTSLSAAVDGAINISEQIHSGGNGSFVPEIVMTKEVSLSSSINTTDLPSLTINFNGNNVNLGSGVALNLGSCNLTLYDSKATTINYTQNATNVRPAGILGEGTAIINTTGTVTINSGYYRNLSGAVITGSKKVTVTNAYLLAGDYIVSSTMALDLKSGFFMFTKAAYEDSYCAFTTPSGMQLSACKITISNSGADGSTINGYSLNSCYFKVTLLQHGQTSDTNPTYDCASFEAAFDKASEVSQANDGIEAVITINDKSITSVNLSQTYTLKKDSSSDYAPFVTLKNIPIARKSESGAQFYDQALFKVTNGKLGFTDCTVDGNISDSEISQGSMIIVDSGATIVLMGTKDKGTVIKNNVGLKGNIASDPCAGIYIKNGGKIQFEGNVKVNNNKQYDGSSKTYTARNVYLDTTAEILISGPITTTEGYVIGLTTAATSIEKGTVVGTLGSSYITKIKAGDYSVIDLSAFYIDEGASYFLNCDVNDYTLIWDKYSSYLPEAGVMRIEYLILIIGIIGFLFKNVAWIKGNQEAEHYITVLSMVCLLLGAAIGFYHIRSESMMVARNNAIVEDMAAEMAAASQKEAVKLSDHENAVVEEEEQPAVVVPDDGRDYIGIIEIDPLGIKLPILARYTDEDMKTTPCVYYGNLENDNLVIVGHNYDSQFGDFNKLAQSDLVEIKISLLDGSTYVYESIDIEYLNPDQIDEMVTGEWDLTLFTCSYSGEKRIAIRANRK